MSNSVEKLLPCTATITNPCATTCIWESDDPGDHGEGCAVRLRPAVAAALASLEAENARLRAAIDYEMACMIFPAATRRGVCQDGSPCPCAPCRRLRSILGDNRS